MYDRAYQLTGDKNLIMPYLYASYKYMSLEEYHILITKQDEYMEANARMAAGDRAISKRRFRMNRARTVLINGSASTAGAIRKASAGTGSRIYALCQNRLKQLRFDRGIFM